MPAIKYKSSETNSCIATNGSTLTSGRETIFLADDSTERKFIRTLNDRRVSSSLRSDCPADDLLFPQLQLTRMSRNFVPEVAMGRRNRFAAHHTFVIFRPGQDAAAAPQQMIRNCLAPHEIPEVKPRRASGVCRYRSPPRNVFFHTLLRVPGNRLLMLIRMRVAHILQTEENIVPGATSARHTSLCTR